MLILSSLSLCVCCSRIDKKRIFLKIKKIRDVRRNTSCFMTPHSAQFNKIIILLLFCLSTSRGNYRKLNRHISLLKATDYRLCTYAHSYYLLILLFLVSLMFIIIIIVIIIFVTTLRLNSCKWNIAC